MKPVFEEMVPYHIDLSGSSIGRLRGAPLMLLFRRDARLIGNVIEQLLRSEFTGLDLPDSRSAKYDLVHVPSAGGGHAWEVKCGRLQAGGICLLPSAMKGAGRRVNLPLFFARVKNLHGYLLAAVDEAPDLRVIGLPSGYILKHRISRVNRRRFNILFGS